MRTVRDELRLKVAAEEAAIEKERKVQREAAIRAALLRDNPEIGELCRKGRPVYYRNNPYREARDPAALLN